MLCVSCQRNTSLNHGDIQYTPNTIAKITEKNDHNKWQGCEGTETHFGKKFGSFL